MLDIDSDGASGHSHPKPTLPVFAVFATVLEGDVAQPRDYGHCVGQLEKREKEKQILSKP